MSVKKDDNFTGGLLFTDDYISLNMMLKENECTLYKFESKESRESSFRLLSYWMPSIKPSVLEIMFQFPD